jgi:hypothetical protein
MMTEGQFKAIAQKLLSEQAQTTLWRDMVLVGWLEMHGNAYFSTIFPSSNDHQRSTHVYFIFILDLR